ncbi:MAG: mevalonate kinase [Candidatus Altiarchaeales archaeon WOR_SM1_86-2]|nr:MAG: mevalonate kinase [Candidatus Altiarchaeales archaeon WOR_SM1_86-2]
MTKASAPAKIILLGEHAAVYGNPVLVAAVDLRTVADVKKRGADNFILNAPDIGIKNFKFGFGFKKINKKIAPIIDAVHKTEDYLNERMGLEITINSKIPVASGLGSSASLAAALVLAISGELGHQLDKEEIAKLAWDIENVVHGKSSGVDPYAVTYGGVLRYMRGKVNRLKIDEYPQITIGNTKITSDTGEVVGDVMRLKEKFPEIFAKLLRIFEELVDDGQNALEHGDIARLGELMNLNHGLLSAIGVSSAELDRLVWAARSRSPGAKLCGAGRGGIMIAMGDVGEEIRRAGGDVISVGICDEGVRIEY